MTTTISDADIAAFQMIGQDIPWQLDHWATHRPDHPFLVWEPKDGNDRTWTYREFVDDVNRVAAGLADRGVTHGRQGPDPRRQLPRRACSPGTPVPASARSA